MNTSRHTPWGPSQTVDEVGCGIVWVTTAGHGGIFVPAMLLHGLPDCLRNFKTWTGSPNWFEEDCDAIVPMLMFPELFEAKQVQYALEAVKNQKYYAEHGLNFDDYILTDQGVRANQIAIEASNYEVKTS